MDLEKTQNKTDYDILIVGAGVVGLSTALACAHSLSAGEGLPEIKSGIKPEIKSEIKSGIKSGIKIGVLDRRDPHQMTQDGRAFALSASSLRMLSRLGVEIGPYLSPIHDMLVTEGVPTSPWRLYFEPDEDEAQLGAVIENRHFYAALLARIEASPNIRLMAPCEVLEAEHDAQSVCVRTKSGVMSAKLLVAADGRNSPLRRAAGIGMQRFEYKEAALVTVISHELPHEQLAWQRFLPGGPLAVLPLLEQKSQIIWSGPQDKIAAACALEADEFCALLSEKMDHYLGDMTLVHPRRSYPLCLQIADKMSATRLALVGDAAHLIHPLAGQGLNLGLRDAAALADGVKAAYEIGQDIGMAGLLDYDRWRSLDVRSLGALTQTLSRIYQKPTPILGHARRLGLSLINKSETLKSQLKVEAAGNAGSLPNLLIP